MTTIVTEELVTTLEQSFTLTQHRIYRIGGVKLDLTMYNAPVGTFTLKIKDGSTTLASQTFDSAEIKSDLSTSNNYAYIKKAIEFDNVVPLKNKTYTLELSASGYTYSDSSFLGWNKPFENLFVERSDSFSSITSNPHGFLLYDSLRNGVY